MARKCLNKGQHSELQNMKLMWCMDRLNQPRSCRILEDIWTVFCHWESHWVVAKSGHDKHAQDIPFPKSKIIYRTEVCRVASNLIFFPPPIILPFYPLLPFPSGVYILKNTMARGEKNDDGENDENWGSEEQNKKGKGEKKKKRGRVIFLLLYGTHFCW